MSKKYYISVLIVMYSLVLIYIIYKAITSTPTVLIALLIPTLYYLMKYWAYKK